MEIYQNILEKEFNARLKKNRNYSLRAFARNMDINHGALSQILSGSRIPSYKLMKKIIEKLNLTGKLALSFQKSIAKSHLAKKPQRINPKLKKIADDSLYLKSESLNIDFEKFYTISEWYHYAIFVMIQKDDFKRDDTQIANILKIKPFQVTMAIERLEKLDLIKSENNILSCKSLHIETASKEKTSTAHKKRIKQILEKSIHSVDDQSIELRNHETMTMAIDPKKIPEAKIRINRFMNDLCEFLESDEKKEVYEFATSLFSLEKNIN